MPEPSHPAGPSVTLNGLVKTYSGGTTAVDGVSVEIAGGSFVALVGSSGSGKSTLLKTINRLIEPSAGSVVIDGTDVTADDPFRLRRRIGYVFQNIGLFPHMTVAENVAIGLRLEGKKATADRVGELLALVDLPADFAKRMPDALSGGQRQRVGVARALATEPKLLLMDEPFGALDPVTRDQLGTAIRDLHDRLALTTIMVTHDMAEALILADRVLVMDKGKVVADAAPRALLAGEGGTAAQALVAVPREQMRRLGALEAGGVSDFLEALSRAPDLLAQHLLLAMAALVLGIVLSLPLAVWSARVPAVGRIALGFASLVQTIPSLALLALFYPLLLSLSTLVGGGIPALGFLPSLLALTLYALLPILRNGVTGLAGIDPAVIEAADGVGMTAGQKLRLVEAPLVAPVLMAGIRTAAVWTIGAATLSTTVGQPSLGDMIFAGLQTQNWALVLAGCFAAAGLALAVDALLGVIERGIVRRKRGRVWIALGVLAAGIMVALAPMLPASKPTIVIGAKGFSEQYILARVIGHRLEAAGYRVQYKEGLGSGVMFAALTSSDVDVAIDYTGTIWTNEMKRSDSVPRDAMLAQISAWEAKRGLNLLGRLGFENAYCFAMRSDRAAALQIASLDDLAAKGGDLSFASDPEFLERPEWKSVKAAYPIRFASANAYSPTFMYRALASGRADVISAYTSDGRIAADKLTVLADPKGAIPNYDAILTISPRMAKDARFVGTLRPLIGRINVEAMREANYMVDRDAGKVSPEAAARWLATKIGL